MQLLLSFAQKPSDESEAEPISEVWLTLQSEQRNETLSILARLLTKTASASANGRLTEKRKERHDD
jgi:hypothetical protein